MHRGSIGVNYILPGLVLYDSDLRPLSATPLICFEVMNKDSNINFIALQLNLYPKATLVGTEESGR